MDDRSTTSNLPVSPSNEQNGSASIELNPPKVQLLTVTKVDPVIELVEPEGFTTMLNSPPTNELIEIHTRISPPIINLITSEATIETGKVKVFIENYAEANGELRTSTHKLLDISTLLLTKQNDYRGAEERINRTVSISLDDYMKYCGISLTKPNKDKTRRRVKEDLETLYSISLEWIESVKGEVKNFSKTRLFTHVEYKRATITLAFSPEMAEHLTNAYVMQYPLSLLKMDERNANSYPLARKLALHSSIDNNIKSGTDDKLSVMKALEVCPDIPTHAQVTDEGRQLEQRIIAPFERALNSIPGLDWEYSNAKGVPLSDDQLDSWSYEVFTELYIKFKFFGAPDHTARIEAKNKRKGNR